tara:strand:+ start:1 stop:864 length:864 start_codon:yes stop_codon:yes gene_type:complete
MTTNVHFSKGTISEQYLYEDLVIEAIGIYGHDVFYLPRTLVNEDMILGEDPLSTFSDAYGIEMWMETQEGYEGEKDIVTRFGLDIQNETSFVVSRRRWDDVVSRNDNLIVNTRPDEGDLIYFPAVKRLWIISFVDHDDPFYQVNNLPVYKLYCRSWEYSSERLDTGIEAIDAIETKRSTDFLGYEILAEQSGTYDQKIEFEWGTIYEFGVGDILLEDDSFVLGETETGFEAIILEDSDDYYTFVVIQEAYSLATQDPQSDNSFIDTAADAILDFTETNPFGEPTSSV